MFILIGLIVATLSENIEIRDELLRRPYDDLWQHAVKLEAINKELVAFSYSISHDLRALLRRIEGFCRHYLKTIQATWMPRAKITSKCICASCKNLGRLIDDRLNLSGVTSSRL
jgi:light-regulated signal transduction histidine kinase (bacteriophytochrome)